MAFSNLKIGWSPTWGVEIVKKSKEHIFGTKKCQKCQMSVNICQSGGLVT